MGTWPVLTSVEKRERFYYLFQHVPWASLYGAPFVTRRVASEKLKPIILEYGINIRYYSLDSEVLAELARTRRSASSLWIHQPCRDHDPISC